LPSIARVAQRAATIARRALPFVAAISIAAGAGAVSAPPVSAATGPKVVIVVGPSGSATARYLERANLYAAQARGYGAAVTQVSTPNATWPRVRAAAQGANILIYLGHGNGWPSPYAPFQTLTKNGFGLNPYAGSGNVTTKYYGEALVASQIRLAPGAIVLLNHLCYASGNGEPGFAEPSWDVARQRVDNYAAGFLRAGAAAVLADGHTGLQRELAYLFGRSQSLLAAWRADPDGHDHDRSFASARTPGFTTHLDPDTANTGFYRSLVTKNWVSTSGIRVQAMTATPSSGLTLRSGPGTGTSSLGTIGAGSTTWVTGALRSDAGGRTWAPVITSSGTTGWVAGWLTTFGGSAVPVTDVRVRSAPSTASGTLGTVRTGVRVAVLGSTRDAANRSWLKVRTSTGVTGWMAGWLMSR
jgi:hypothetical protein